MFLSVRTPKQETMFQKKISPFVLCLVSLKTAVAGKGLRLPSCSNFFPIHIFVPIRFSPKKHVNSFAGAFRLRL